MVSKIKHDSLVWWEFIDSEVVLVDWRKHVTVLGTVEQRTHNGARWREIGANWLHLHEAHHQIEQRETSQWIPIGQLRVTGTRRLLWIRSARHNFWDDLLVTVHTHSMLSPAIVSEMNRPISVQYADEWMNTLTRFLVPAIYTDRTRPQRSWWKIMVSCDSIPFRTPRTYFPIAKLQITVAAAFVLLAATGTEILGSILKGQWMFSRHLTTDGLFLPSA